MELKQMKIKLEDFNFLEKACYSTLHENSINPSLIKDIRQCWNLFFKASRSFNLMRLYDYLDDSHIETALRKIFHIKKGN
jgi:hypothetical protein